MYIALSYPISHGHWLKHLVSTCIKDTLEWFDCLCASSPQFPDCKTVCVSYGVSGNKTSSTTNLNPQSASVYSQPHILRFPCHMLVKHRWIDDVDRFCNQWQISTVVDLSCKTKNDRCMWTCQMSWCKLSEYSGLQTQRHAKVVSCVTTLWP